MKGQNHGQIDLVSVVIPSYNHEQFVVDAITSVLEQSYENLELIVVDDGSSDSSVNLVREIKDPRLKLIVQENTGAHNAINRGVAESNGMYLAVLNSDDLFHPQRLQVCVDVLNEKNNIGFVSTWLEVIDDAGRMLGTKEGWSNMHPWYLGDPSKSITQSDSYELNLLASNFVSTTSNMVFRRDLFNKIGGMRNLRFVHDWDFVFRVAQVVGCEQINQPLVKYRIHGNNTISSDRKWMLFEICWVIAVNMHRYYGLHIFKGRDDLLDLSMLSTSLNFQGNDRLVWLILSYMHSLEARGVEHPDTVLIDDESVRLFFVDQVVDKMADAESEYTMAEREYNADFILRLKSKLRRLFGFG